MPKKTVEDEVTSEELTIEPAKPAKEAKFGGCGHVNRQHYGTDGKLLEIVCDLEPKHEGDHHARAMRNVPEPVTNEKGIVTSVKQRQEEVGTWWGDKAAALTRDVIANVAEQMSLLQKDLVMDILNKNPNLTVEQAIAQAKASNAWQAASVPS